MAAEIRANVAFTECMTSFEAFFRLDVRYIAERRQRGCLFCYFEHVLDMYAIKSTIDNVVLQNCVRIIAKVPNPFLLFYFSNNK